MPDHRMLRLTFRGDLDIHRRDEVAGMLPAPGSVDEVVLDFSGVMFIDSTILTVLLRYRRAFEEAGGDPINIVIIANSHGRRFLDIAGVSQSLTVVTALGN